MGFLFRGVRFFYFLLILEVLRGIGTYLFKVNNNGKTLEKGMKYVLSWLGGEYHIHLWNLILSLPEY